MFWMDDGDGMSRYTDDADDNADGYYYGDGDNGIDASYRLESSMQQSGMLVDNDNVSALVRRRQNTENEREFNNDKMQRAREDKQYFEQLQDKLLETNRGMTLETQTTATNTGINVNAERASNSITSSGPSISGSSTVTGTTASNTNNGSSGSTASGVTTKPAVQTRKDPDPIPSGFVDVDGRRRNYDTPAPPKGVNWVTVLEPYRIKVAVQQPSPIAKSTVPTSVPTRTQTQQSAETPTRTFSIMDTYALLPDGKPGEDFYEGDTKESARETNEVLVPVAIIASRMPKASLDWDPMIEQELRYRGVKLADVEDIRIDHPNEMEVMMRNCPSLAATMPPREYVSQTFTCRSYHVGYRYFVNILLGGSETVKTKFIGFYYTSLTHEQAVMERCV